MTSAVVIERRESVQKGRRIKGKMGQSTLEYAITPSVTGQLKDDFSETTPQLIELKCGGKNTTTLLLFIVQPEVTETELKQFEKYATSNRGKIMHSLIEWNLISRCRLIPSPRKDAKLGYDLLEKQNVNFSSEELTSYPLTPEVKVLMVITTVGESRTEFFSHQIIMKMHTRFYISNMKPSNLDIMIKNYLHLFHFENIRQIPYGVQMNEKILEKPGPIVEDHLKQHQMKAESEIMSHSTVDIGKLKQRSKLVLQTSTYSHEISAEKISGETGNCNFVGKHDNDPNLRNLLEVQIAHNCLTDERIAFLALKLGKNQRLDEVELRDCELDKPILENFDVTTEASGCKIDKFSISLSKHLKDLLPRVCKIVECCETKTLSIAENNVTGDEITKLEEILKDMKETELRGLDVSNNVNLGNLLPLGRLIQSRGLTDLNLMSCELTDKQLGILSSVQGILLHSVNIGFNSEITRKGFKCLSSLLHPAKIDLLDITGCEMTGDKLNELKEVLTNREVIELNVNYNELQCPDMKILGELSQNSKVHMLGVVGCDLDGRRLTLFNGALRQHKFETLDASDNNKLGGCIKEVATLTKRCSALNISECGLQAEEICSFTSEMEGSTIEILNVSDSNRVITEGSRMLQSLCSLIPIVTNKLLLCFKEVNAISRVILKSQLTKLQKKDLQIVCDQSCYCEDQNGFSFVMSKKDDVLK